MRQKRDSGFDCDPVRSVVAVVVDVSFRRASSVLFRLISNFAEFPAEEGSTLSLIVAVSLLSSSVLGDKTS